MIRKTFPVNGFGRDVDFPVVPCDYAMEQGGIVKDFFVGERRKRGSFQLGRVEQTLFPMENVTSIIPPRKGFTAVTLISSSHSPA